MFSSLFNSLFGKTKDNNLSNCFDNNESDQDASSDQTKQQLQEFDSDVTAILLDEDKDWLFVERREDLDNDSHSIDRSRANLQLVPFKNIFSHLGSISENDEKTFLSANLPSFYPNSMDDSWFLTPPECFSSLSSIQLETSPLENLLIEHPSMSVYYNYRRGSMHSINHGETIDDLVVIELSQNDEEEDQMEKIKTKRSDKKNNKKSRIAGAPKNVALVLVKKNNVQKTPDQRKTSLGKAATERNNKCYALRHTPKRTTVINQPTCRMMMIKKN